MSVEVYRRDLADRRSTTAALAAGLAVLAVFVLSVAAALGETITRLTEAFPDALTAFIGTDAPGGYVVGEVFELIAPVAVVAFAVTGGAATVAGEEARGTMALLAAQPLSRRRLLASKAAALATSLAVVTAALFAAVTLVALPAGIGLDAGGVAAACLQLFALAAAFGALALAVGCATGRPDVATAVAGTAALAAYLASALLPLAGLDRWAVLSPWSAYDGTGALASGVDVGGLLTLGGLAAAALVAAFLLFPRRDLKG